MSAPHSFAQTVQGDVLGTVKDAAGAVVPGATVTLTDTDTGTVRTAHSDASGNYEFTNAEAGHYSVNIEMAGFERWNTGGLTLSVRQQLRVDAKMALGSVQQTVSVSGNTVATIDTETPSISAVYNKEAVADLPVNTRASSAGTSALNIIGTLPGVQPDHGSFSLQGGLPFETEVSVDGITVQSATGNSPIADALPSTESISELRADGAQNNAEFGQPGEVTVTTKGGTNTIHGSGFWYHQNAAFDAIPYTDPITTSKPKLVANTFGGSFGGPVVIPHVYDGHNKTFIFGAYEGWRHPSQGTYSYKVPSTLMKQGDFSQYVSPNFDGSLRDPFTGGSYGTALSAIDAASQKFLQFYPDPNVGAPTAYTDNGIDNYIINKDDSAHSDQFDIRADQYFGSNQKFLLWGRYTWKNYPTTEAEPLAVPNGTSTNQNRVLKISASYTFTPHLINEFGFGFTLNTTGDTNSFNGTTFTNGLGLTGLQNLFYNGLPELDFYNISSLNADRLDSLTKSRTYVYTDGLTWNHGNHDVRVGLDIRHLEAITPLGFNGADNYGTFGFNTSSSNSLFTGVDFADFLLGLPNQTFYDVVQEDNDGKSIFYSFYAQDEWKATDRLTLSYGLRYELQPGYYDPNGDIGNFNPAIAKSGEAIYPDGKQSLLANTFLESANACTPYGTTSGGATVNGAACMPVLSNGQAGLPSGLKNYPKLRFLPRFGFAYRPLGNDDTVVRGGFGMYGITLLGGNFYSLTGTLQAQTSDYTNTYNANTHAIGYQWPSIYAGAGSTGCSTCYGTDYFGTANSVNWKDPYMEQWSLSVDHDFGAGNAMRISYIGSAAHQLVWAPDENTLPFSSTVSAANQPLSARLFPNWGRIYTRATGANESYESVQLDASHRFHHGLQFDSVYTFAKALADNQGPGSNEFAGETGGNRSSSILDRAADFGNVAGTRRQRWNTTAIYDLPFGHGREFGAHMPRIADLVVGGWRLSNIFVWQTGPYESPYFAAGEGDPSGTGSGLTSTNTGFDPGHHSQAADRVFSQSTRPSGQNRYNWVNKAAFTCPGYPGWTPGTDCTIGSGAGPYPLPIGRFGNAQVGSVEGPGLVNLSTGLSKVFPIYGRFTLRAEGTFTNVLNHTNLGDPEMDISSPSFGLITSTIGSDFGGARTGQVSMRLDF